MPIIKNKEEISGSRLRKDIISMLEAGISEVLPDNILKKSVRYIRPKRILKIKNRSFKLRKGRIFVVGGGKASGLMAQTLEKLIPGSEITAGVINCKTDDYKTKKIEIIKAGHPVPDDKGVKGVDKMLSLKQEYNIDKNDVVICLLSGGGSALMPRPAEEISLKDEKRLTDILIKTDVDIHDINIIRKHLSQIKGGRLSDYFYPARIISLIISDVVGDNLDIIASGPTSSDSSTYADAMQILKDNRLVSKVPGSILKHLKKGISGKLKDTPEKIKNTWNFILGNNHLALEAMKTKAKKLGLKPKIVTSKQIGNTEMTARVRAKEIIEEKYKGHDTIIVGGETTQTIPKKHGKGGRNQYFASVSMLSLAKLSKRWAMASIGTDGSDYISDVAGAIVDDKTLETIRNKKLDAMKFIKRHDCYNLLSKAKNSLIKTGNTGTNVCDVMVYRMG